MAEIEVSKTRSFKGMRWVARIVSLLPGAAIILFPLGLSVYYLLEGSPELLNVWGLSYAIYYGLPLLCLGLLAWKWPRVGGILLILMAASVFRFAWAPGTDMLDPMIGLPIGAAFLIGGILHLIISSWGRGKEARMTEIETSESRSFKGMRWVARIISLLPGVATILFVLHAWHSYLGTGMPWFDFLLGAIFYGLPLLSLGLLAWKWPCGGGILLILMAAFFFSSVWVPGLSLGAALLIGGILHLAVSPWGRRLWHKSSKA